MDVLALIEFWGLYGLRWIEKQDCFRSCTAAVLLFCEELFSGYSKLSSVISAVSQVEVNQYLIRDSFR